jgi:GNAT superfamily N-acetyltransferase
MTDSEFVTAADVRLMQGLAQQVTATRLDLVNGEATFGELAWGWAVLPHQVKRSDGSMRDVVGANLMYWAAHGYETDLVALGDDGDWTQLNERDLAELERPALPGGFRFRTADEAGPRAAVQAHLDAWAPSTYSAAAYEAVKQTTAYRGDLHILVEAPDATMAASTIMWLDEANRTAEFEPVGTHPDYRRRGLGRAMLLHGLHRARAAGATHATVACLGAPGHPRARGLFYGVGFRELSRDAPLIKAPGRR